MKNKVVIIYFLVYITYVILAKSKNDLKVKKAYLRYGKNDQNIQNRKREKRNHMYLNNCSLLSSKNNNVNKTFFKYNKFIDQNNDKEYFKKTVFKNGSIIKFRYTHELWAKKKGVGSSRNGRDSNPKNLGVKVLGNNFAHAGNIIVRQRGRTFKPGNGVKQGRDFTLIAVKSGKVHFFNRVVSIIDVSEPKPLTFKDIYQENPTIIGLSKMWMSA
ncbi:apicoplast ribosomal protein L27 precursor, putative [Plasmodium reichenowi]|uniref:Apicoplast ribosomal protein L27, putative n=1 Tax=Plasmodium reichenowi TaxID=5854 RepID=A0A2P9DHJ1_PLARE|nr:apicoplast ribosomal protein L27 precursor, putative [Plasmodium reichenowi]